MTPRAIRKMCLAAACALLWLLQSSGAARATGSLAELVDEVQPKIAKVHGAGGFRGLEAYQSGVVVSGEGHILTVWSYVLDTDYISVTLADGRRFDAKLAAVDPRLELAVLKIEASDLAHFEPADSAPAEPYARILAFSNLFGVATGDEPVSVQQGIIAARTELDARRGAFATPYHGEVYVLDAVTNNPGAAGGAVVDLEGRLVGMLGKELRSAQNSTWLNYAVPADVLARMVDDVREGRFAATAGDDPDRRPLDAQSLARLGIVLVPDVLPRTPPYVEAVRPDSPAARGGLLRDDLIVMVAGKLAQTCAEVQSAVEFVDAADRISLTVQRETELVELTLSIED